jgi:hypothetical protein
LSKREKAFFNRNLAENFEMYYICFAVSDMASRKKKVNKKEKNIQLLKEIKKASKNLFYISETDAEISAFDGGKSEEISADIILERTESEKNAKVEERDFGGFFERLTKIQDWFEEEEIENANRFAYLRDLLKNNLRDLKVYKVGEIQIKIYVAGLDAEDDLFGIQTEAVET